MLNKSMRAFDDWSLKSKENKCSIYVYEKAHLLNGRSPNETYKHETHKRRRQNFPTRIRQIPQLTYTLT